MCEHKRKKRTTFSGNVCLDCGDTVIPKIKKLFGLRKQKKVGILPMDI